MSGASVTPDTLVAAVHTGDSPEEIHEQYPTVELADVHAVSACYLRFAPEGIRARLLPRRSG